jgi:hypothetical protein
VSVTRSRVSRATQLLLGVEPIGKVATVSGAAREEKFAGAHAYGFDVNFGIRRGRDRAVVYRPTVADAANRRMNSADAPYEKKPFAGQPRTP